MLSVGKIAATPTAGQYYVEHVAGGVEDYYAGGVEMPGVWAGAGAEALSLRNHSQPRAAPARECGHA